MRTPQDETPPAPGGPETAADRAEIELRRILAEAMCPQTHRELVMTTTPGNIDAHFYVRRVCTFHQADAARVAVALVAAGVAAPGGAEPATDLNRHGDHLAGVQPGVCDRCMDWLAGVAAGAEQARRDAPEPATDREGLRERIEALAAEWEQAEAEDIYDEAENAASATWRLAAEALSAALVEDPPVRRCTCLSADETRGEECPVHGSGLSMEDPPAPEPEQPRPCGDHWFAPSPDDPNVCDVCGAAAVQR